MYKRQLLWYGDFLGFLVLCIISYGFLTRSFADSIDETNASCIKALEATGANYWQIVVHAVIPETMPSLISWTLYLSLIHIYQLHPPSCTFAEGDAVCIHTGSHAAAGK